MIIAEEISRLIDLFRTLVQYRTLRYQRFRDVRFWHKADISRLSSNVRFWGKADIAQTLPHKMIIEARSNECKSLL